MYFHYPLLYLAEERVRNAFRDTMVECSGEPFYNYVVCVTKNKRIILITYAMLKCFVAGKWGGRLRGSSLAIFSSYDAKNNEPE